MQAYTIFSEMVGWDVPPILLEGREKLRVIAYMAKRIAKLDFERHSVKVEPPVDGHKQISMICTFHVTVLPEFLPIPTIKLKATVNLGVSDDFHKVRQLCDPDYADSPLAVLIAMFAEDCHACRTCAADGAAMLIVPLVVGQPIGPVSNSANHTVHMCKASSFHPYLTQALKVA